MKRINKIMAEEPTPKKRTRKSAKSVSNGVDSPSVKPSKISGGEINAQNSHIIKALIQAALKEGIDKQKHVRESEDNINALISTVSEFLDCFVIIGYDQEGDPAVVSYAQTSRDGDALRNLYVKFLPQFMQSADDLGDPEEM
jgi:hypothetical protein